MCAGIRVRGGIDILLFNPPYVPTPPDEVQSPIRSFARFVSGPGPGGPILGALLPGGGPILGPVLSVCTTVENTTPNIQRQNTTLSGERQYKRQNTTLECGQREGGDMARGWQTLPGQRDEPESLAAGLGQRVLACSQRPHGGTHTRLKEKGLQVWKFPRLYSG